MGILKMKLGGHIRFIKFDGERTIEKIETKDLVDNILYFVDCQLDVEAFKGILKTAKMVVVVDQRCSETRSDELKNFSKRSYLKALVRNDRTAARQLWEYCWLDKKTPDLLLYLQDWQLQTAKFKLSRFVHFGFEQSKLLVSIRIAELLKSKELERNEIKRLVRVGQRYIEGA